MFDARNNRVFVDDSDLRAIVVIDLATGERAISARGNRRLELNDQVILIKILNMSSL